MIDETPGEGTEETTARWHHLPPRTRLEDTTATQETPPKPAVIADPPNATTELTKIAQWPS